MVYIKNQIPTLISFSYNCQSYLQSNLKGILKRENDSAKKILSKKLKLPILSYYSRNIMSKFEYCRLNGGQDRQQKEKNE